MTINQLSKQLQLQQLIFCQLTHQLINKSFLAFFPFFFYIALAHFDAVKQKEMISEPLAGSIEHHVSTAQW